MLVFGNCCAGFMVDPDFCKAVGEAVFCAPPVDGTVFFAVPADARVFCAAGAVFPADVDGFTAVFFSPLDTGPSADIDRFMPSPYPLIRLPTPPMPPATPGLLKFSRVQCTCSAKSIILSLTLSSRPPGTLYHATNTANSIASKSSASLYTGFKQPSSFVFNPILCGRKHDQLRLYDS